MVEALQMFLFLFKSKYRRKFSWFSPFLCSVLIVLLFCDDAFSRCSEEDLCINGECRNDTCVCFEGWQGPECQYCGGKVKLTAPRGIITDGPGNYSTSVQCSWLIAPDRAGPDPPPIRIRLESFATECGWDHLYVYDGNSVRAERLLAVFSGVLQEGESKWTRQVVARSGQALLHFFSDDAYAMEGFNVTYAAYSCPSDSASTNCSSHGTCYDGYCKCELGWQGIACEEPICPDNCNAAYGGGNCTAVGCECNPSRSGLDCARDVNQAGWTWLWREPGEGAFKTKPPVGLPPPVAGHVLLNAAGNIISVGGESFGDRAFLYKYKVSENRWYPVAITGLAPAPRYLHSAIMYGHELIVYGGLILSDHPDRGGGLAGLEGRGGTVTNELWRLRLDVTDAQWTNATPTVCSGHRPAPIHHCGGLQVSGHTAVLAYLGVTRKPVMLVFFGHSPHYGYLHIVQEYYIDEGVWSVAATQGWAARGGFGHSTVYDPVSNKVYVHGGLLSESEATQAPSSALHEYDIEKRLWRPLPSSTIPRYLHSATFVSPGIMLVFGGNAHNDSAATSMAGARCYSGGAELYHLRCRLWLPAPPPPSAARAAHAAILLPNRNPRTLLVYGGFDGRLRSDGLGFESGASCATFVTQYSCMNAPHYAARACVWRTRVNLCVPLEEVGWEESFDSSIRACLSEPVMEEGVCGVAGSCAACTAARCAWCGVCVPDHTYCPAHRHQVALVTEECAEEPARAACVRFHSCAACHAHTHHHNQALEETNPRICYWDYDTIKCRPANSSDDIRSVASLGPCSAPCATFQSCANCTAEECIWCASAAKCVDKNAYGASFPLGGCRLWSTTGGGAGCSALTHAPQGCQAHQGCATCRAEPACGWCDDGARGGAGACLPGAADAPHRPHTCVAERWHFTSCPVCQCNGHSVCDEDGRCIQPCGGRAAGEHCDKCASHHWGSPLNKATCHPCECNAQAVSCAPDTGKCHCSVKGLAGDRCDKCDSTNHYHPDIYNRGSCYYDLAVDYQFTFNLSKKEDRHLTAINFRNAPVKPDVDADFTITCSSHARMNLTVRSRAEPGERVLFTDINCTNFRNKFSKSEHAFGVEDNITLTTFFVYVYDFKPPLWIQISFSQYPKLNLQQFFITFSSCFLLLLLVAAALWKIKQVPCPLALPDNITLTTFFVYVYDFKPPLWIQISFSQYPKLNLQQFFITFSSCFLLLLLVAAALWKIKQVPCPLALPDNITLTTFFVYVYDFKPPLWIQISFSQYPKLNLQQFFITFSSCFLLLLLVAAALWKIKQKYDMYRRRQRLFVEMEQMASRPFSQVLVELEKSPTENPCVPAPVALEPCAGSRAAVLSLLVRLPTGGTGVAPPLGGLAIASALVTLGHAPPHTKHGGQTVSSL